MRKDWLCNRIEMADVVVLVRRNSIWTNVEMKAVYLGGLRHQESTMQPAPASQPPEFVHQHSHFLDLHSATSIFTIFVQTLLVGCRH